MEKTTQSQTDYGSETAFVLAYFALYMGYLFLNPEGELAHWITLVLVPFTLLYIYQRRGQEARSVSETLASLGIKKGALGSGLRWAIPVGILLGTLQLVVSRQRIEFWDLVVSGRVLYLFPLAFLLLLFTAGFTEEFFFRGVVQTRLTQRLGSNVVAILITALLFGLYHVPYAYLNPNWPSHGDLSAALASALLQGGIGGIVLGLVYWRSRNNLVAPVVVHTLLNTLPAMTLIRFG